MNSNPVVGPSYTGRLYAQVLLGVETGRDAYVPRDDAALLGGALVHALVLPVALCVACTEFWGHVVRALNVLCCVKPSSTAVTDTGQSGLTTSTKLFIQQSLNNHN